MGEPARSRMWGAPAHPLPQVPKIGLRMGTAQQAWDPEHQKLPRKPPSEPPIVSGGKQQPLFPLKQEPQTTNFLLSGTGFRQGPNTARTSALESSGPCLLPTYPTPHRRGFPSSPTVPSAGLPGSEVRDEGSECHTPWCQPFPWLSGLVSGHSGPVTDKSRGK